MIRFLFGLVELAIVLTVVALLGLMAGFVAYRYPGPLTEKKIVIIAQGKGASEIADQLLEAGVIRGPKALFLAAAVVTDQRSLLKAGEYEFTPGERMVEVMRQLATGQVVIRKIRVVEGTVAAQALAQLRAEPVLTGAIPESVPEGSIFPDTYFFDRGESRQSVLNRMQTAMNQAVTDAWATRSPDLPAAINSPQAMLTLASIVEKETGLAYERERIAGVYANRLNKGMKLQSDPTVIYALTLGRRDLGRALMLNDLQTPSPYNTYFVDGLPPGPICLPGKAALRAAAHPEVNDYLYFVANGNGGHAFARDLFQHNKNVLEWRRLQRQRAAGQASHGSVQ